MSRIFPRLKHLTLIGFTSASLLLFSDCVENLLELTTVDIRGLTQGHLTYEELKTVLDKLFTMNNNRLNSISFDDESMSFAIKNENINITYANIEKINIKLKTLIGFHNLVTLLPRLQSLDATIDGWSLELSTKDEPYPVCEVREFSLRGLKCSWSWDYLRTVLNRMPKIEKLTLILASTSDSRLLVGEEFFFQLNILPLKKFNYTLAFYNCSIDIPTVLSTWHQFRSESIAVESDNVTGLMLYTLPPDFRQLNVPYSLITSVADAEFIKICCYKIQYIYLDNLPSDINETFLLLTKCYRIKRLTLVINGDEQSSKYLFFNGKKKLLFICLILVSTEQIILRKLPFLTSVELPETKTIDIKDFQILVEASPNLFNLIVNCEILRPFFDNGNFCRLLGQRITHLKIILPSRWFQLDEVPVISLVSTFPHVKHLSFDASSMYGNLELLIIYVLNHLSEWNSLISFSILDAKLTDETLTKSIHEWVSENICESHRNAFQTNYVENTFHLWL